MYLHHSIIKEDGRAYPMCDVLPGDCFNTTRLTRFGYVSIAEKQPAFLPPDTSIRGHEFHYYDSSENGSDAISVKPLTDKSWESSFIGKNHWWGFAHLYYPSSPAFPKNFVQRCQEI
jgi:cobyrinic acid a,c-diamide synthase